MAGVDAMIKSMEKHLGLGEPNFIQDWYRARNGSAYAGNFAWCNATITWAAVDSGNYDEVCFGTDYAYTVAHAQRFNSKGQWTAMTHGVVASGIKRGDIVFFDWAGGSSIGGIDHVGIVTSVDGATVYTIEGNISNKLQRKVRGVAEIAGFGRPKYKAAPKPPVVTPPVVVTPPAAGTYVVKAGDSLSAIAVKYKTTVAVLVALNKLSDPDELNVGQVLKLPVAVPVKYEPFPGTALFKDGKKSPIIAAMHKRLVAVGCNKYQSNTNIDTWGSGDEASYKAWQKKCGFTGSGADGIPGPDSWKKLQVPNV